MNATATWDPRLPSVIHVSVDGSLLVAMFPVERLERLLADIRAVQEIP